MAYLVKRGGKYHLCHRATPDGKRTRITTGYKINVAGDIRAAKEMEAEYSYKEAQTVSSTPKFRANERWDSWLPQFVEMKYRNKPGTLRRWKSVERTLRMFWTDFKIETPRQLTRQHCFDYFKWRVTPPVTGDKEKDKAAAKARRDRGLHPATHNTALLEMQALGVLMKEAVHRGFANANPCRELGVGRDEVKKPMDLTDDILSEIEARIAETAGDERLILERGYLVARYHGVRLVETRVNPVSDVLLRDENTSEITFFQKGGRKRTKPLHPKLFPLFKELQASGATELYPHRENLAAFWFWHFDAWKMKRHGKVCFHSLRVTVQNKLRRAGVNDEIRRAYLSHEQGKDVHEGYSRIKIDEMRVCHAAL